MQNTQTESTPKLNINIPTMKELLEAGVQFGHPIEKWNPKMGEFIYTKRDGFHIFNLLKTQQLLEKALQFLQNAASRGEIVFVGTKRQAADIVKEEAIRCGAHYIVNRWVGGIFTNFDLIKKNFDALNDIEKAFTEGVSNRTKQEIMWLKKKWSRFNRLYEGIRYLKGRPSAVIIIDSHYEKAAVKEAMSTGIPVISIVDTNADPDKVTYPIPGNDDALKSIRLFMKLFADSVLIGNKGNGVKYKFVDYAKYDVEIKKERIDIAKIEGKEIPVAEEVKEVKEVKVDIIKEKKKESPKKIVKKTVKPKIVKKSKPKAKTTQKKETKKASTNKKKK